MIQETSKEALESILEHLPNMEAEVLAVIHSYGKEGCIQDDVREALREFSYSGVTARFATLERKGLILRHGDTRIGVHGRPQMVMRAV